MNAKKYSALVLATAVLFLGAATMASAANKPLVTGKVSAISANTLTVVGPRDTYTVDASSAKITRGGQTLTVANVGVGDQVMVQGSASGTNISATTIKDLAPKKRAVQGTVTGISGSTITIQTNENFRSIAQITYTVNSSGAKIMRGGNTITLADIKTGDRLLVQGSIAGTTITATTILDTAPKPLATPIITGNGQPVVAGKVTAINGSTLTVTNNSNVTYTVDASNAKVVADGATKSLSDIKVDSAVIIQGTVNGNSVTASTILLPETKQPQQNGQGRGPKMGVFQGMGNFFKKIFGF